MQVLRRTNRQGYKAGAMVEGLEVVAGRGFKYCELGELLSVPRGPIKRIFVHHI